MWLFVYGHFLVPGVRLTVLYFELNQILIIEICLYKACKVTKYVNCDTVLIATGYYPHYLI